MKMVVSPYVLTAQKLSSGEKIALSSNAMKTEKHLSFTCDLSSLGDGKVLVGHGYNASSASWIEITSKEVKAFSYYSYTDPQYRPLFKEPLVHNFEIKDFLTVVIDIDTCNGMKTLLVSTSSGAVKATLDGWDGCYGEVFASVEGAELENCKLNWFSDSFSRRIWFLGDSYIGFGHGARWPYYLWRDGYNNHLVSGFPGMAAQEAIVDFARYVEHGTPEFAVWALGMNNTDKDGKINEQYLSATEEFLRICAERGITPILSTVPNVPERDNRPKNDWVRSQPYRYIDFARAVGSEKDVSWYPEMLSADLVHPSAKGAEALYMQVLCDFPEVMQKSNT